MARLGRLVGRGRALEILLGGDDIPAGLAAEYGYVNRVIPDGEIEGFTDAFARRIAVFDKVAVAGIKKLVDVATLPEDDEFAPGLQAYFATVGRPENQPFAVAAAQQRPPAARRRDQLVMIEKYAKEQARSEHLQGAALGLDIRTARHARPHRSRVEPIVGKAAPAGTSPSTSPPTRAGYG